MQHRNILEQQTGLPIATDVPLKHHTSFGIGGPAALYAEADSTRALSTLLRCADTLALEVLIIGGGTNLLVSDDGFDGLAIRLVLDKVTVDENRARIRAEAGVSTSALVDLSVRHSLGGLTFAAGLPGTIGGGIAGNAGCFGRCLGDALLEATLVSRAGEIIRISDTGWFDFEYRHSKLLRSGHVITEALYQLAPTSSKTLEADAQKNVELRHRKHPAKGMRTAGSYFKNLPPKEPGGRRLAAGMFLDRAGVKGLSVRDAKVFEKHANIIVNTGGASAEDVLTLAATMQRRVRDKFGIRLEPEVRFIGPRPDGL